MTEQGNYILLWLLGTPAVAALIIALLPTNKKNDKDIKAFSVFLSLLPLAIGAYLYYKFVSGESKPVDLNIYWFSKDFALEYFYSTFYLRLDGMSGLMVLLTVILTPILVLASFSMIKSRVKEFLVVLFLSEATILGAFLANDLLVFYLFWEIMLIPVFMILIMWGHENRFAASMKFFVYTMFGSLIMLFAVIYMYVGFQQWIDAGLFSDADFLTKREGGLALMYEFMRSGQSEMKGLFWAFALAFAIKVPLFPLHTWLPQTYKNAPIIGNVILTALMAKVGIYAFLRFAIPLFPESAAAASDLIIVLGLIGVIYGAMMAFAQTDIKQMLAYSSISHLGLVMVGVFAFVSGEDIAQINGIALQGALYQMFNHGLTAAGLFLLVGFLYERGGSYYSMGYGALAKYMPVYSVLFMLIMLASIGLPGMNGFFGELLVITGVFSSSLTYSLFAVLGVILGAAYMLLMYQRLFFGSGYNLEVKEYPDLSVREVSIIVPIAVLSIIGGIFPWVFTDSLSQVVPHVNSLLEKALAG